MHILIIFLISFFFQIQVFYQSLEQFFLTVSQNNFGNKKPFFLQALANLAYEMNAKRIALISSSRSTVHTLLEEATALGIRVQHILELENIDRKGGESDSELPLKVEKFLRNLPGKRPVVAVIVEAVEAVAIAEYLKHVQLSIEPIWLIGSLGLDLHKLSAWRTVFHGGLFVEPHMPELAEFKNFFIEALQVCLSYFTNYRLTYS